MAQIQVFVSHSHDDDAFCRGVVSALRDAGADVWYDEHNLGHGELMEVIQRELDRRAIFILILSKHAFASKWVKRETTWAYRLYDRDPSRLILPVTAADIEDDDFSGASGWLFLSDFKRIEAPGLKPFPLQEACGRLLHALALTAPGAPTATPTPQPTESVDELLAQGKALMAQYADAEAIPFFERVTKLDPNNFDAWANLGRMYSWTGRASEALAAAERALALRPDFALGWHAKGAALGNLGRPNEALVAYDQALSLDPTFAATWASKGGALCDLGRFVEALAACDRRHRLMDTSEPLRTAGMELVVPRSPHPAERGG